MTHESRQFYSSKSLSLLFAAFLLGGCAGHPPTEKIAAAEQSLLRR